MVGGGVTWWRGFAGRGDDDGEKQLLVLGNLLLETKSHVIVHISIPPKKENMHLIQHSSPPSFLKVDDNPSLCFVCTSLSASAAAAASSTCVDLSASNVSALDRTASQ
jgi:hypothetical protein